MSPLSSRMIVTCCMWDVSDVFNIDRGGLFEDRQDSKCVLLHVHIGVGDGNLCFKHELVLS